MTLKEWMDQQDRKAPWLARQLRIGQWTARRLISGDRMPDKESMLGIVRLTAGAVTANDFYDIPSQPVADVDPSAASQRPSLPAQAAE